MNKSKFIKNVVFGFGGQLIILALGLIVPRMMISSYGSDVNGLVSTITQIFSYMALLEAGIGQAAKNALYKPIIKNDKNGIQIPGYDSISVEKDKKNVKMNLANPKDNKCYFNFKIILDDTAETIYESKAVPPGQSIRNVTLTKPLSAGNYDSTIEISTLALDGVTTLNGARTKVHLIAR